MGNKQAVVEGRKHIVRRSNILCRLLFLDISSLNLAQETLDGGGMTLVGWISQQFSSHMSSI